MALQMVSTCPCELGLKQMVEGSKGKQPLKSKNILQTFVPVVHS